MHHSLGAALTSIRMDARTASGSPSQASMTAVRSESSGSALGSAGDAPVRNHSLPYVMTGMNALAQMEMKPLWDRVLCACIRFQTGL